MSGQSTPKPCFVQLFIEILNVMVGALAHLPPNPGTPGRAAACAGIRAFLQRLVGSIGPDCQVVCQPPKMLLQDVGMVQGETSTASNWLLLTISSAVPHFIDAHQNQKTTTVTSDSDPDIRWRELREHMPLFTQVASRYKVRANKRLIALCNSDRLLISH